MKIIEKNNNKKLFDASIVNHRKEIRQNMKENIKFRLP